MLSGMRVWLSTGLTVAMLWLPAALALAQAGGGAGKPSSTQGGGGGGSGDKTGAWIVTSSGPVYSGGNTAWTYTVRSDGDVWDLSHLSLALCQAVEPLSSTATPSSFNTFGTGQDGSLDGTPYVLKFDTPLAVGNTATITVTYRGTLPVRDQTYYVKASTRVFTDVINGVACDASPAGGGSSGGSIGSGGSSGGSIGSGGSSGGSIGSGGSSGGSSGGGSSGGGSSGGGSGGSSGGGSGGGGSSGGSGGGGNKTGNWVVTSSGPLHTGGNTVWTYIVRSNGDVWDLSHLSLALCQSVEPLSASAMPSAFNTFGTGQDGSLDGRPYVLKFDTPLAVGNTAIIVVTYRGTLPVQDQQYYVKASTRVFSGAINGVGCEPPPPGPAPPGPTAPGGGPTPPPGGGPSGGPGPGAPPAGPTPFGNRLFGGNKPTPETPPPSAPPILLPPVPPPTVPPAPPPPPALPQILQPPRPSPTPPPAPPPGTVAPVPGSNPTTTTTTSLTPGAPIRSGGGPGAAFQGGTLLVPPGSGPSLAGRICSPPAPGAELTARGPTGSLTRVTVPKGGRLGEWREYAILSLTAGTYTVTLAVPGQAPVSQAVTVAAEGVTEVPDFSLACTGGPGNASPIFGGGGALILAGLWLRRRAGAFRP